jgi:inner membrane protein
MKLATTLKLLVIGGITLVMLIALAMINHVIAERQGYRDEAVKSIADSYAGAQTIVGPVLVRPYKQTTMVTEDLGKGRTGKSPRTESFAATSFPALLNVTGSLNPTERRHGIYKVTTYEFSGRLEGAFDVIPPKTEGTVEWGEPYLALSVEDVRGIAGTPKVLVNGVSFQVSQGAGQTLGWKPNLHVPLTGLTNLAGRIRFSIDLALDGTEMLNIAPAGDSNHVELSSSWPSPLFAGRFLPRTRSVTAGGFAGAWDISSLATGTQAQMTANPVPPLDLISVDLLTPIDPYKLSDRATKYGFLFILLTFSGFLLFETLKQVPIHPVQYLLVGFGLAIFFLLLISFSEHLAFALAYAIASIACIGLLTFFLSYVLRSATRGLGFGAMLATLYAAVYGLLISEDNALILGSLLLFFVLAAVMVVTRKVDWYARPSAPAGSPAAPAGSPAAAAGSPAAAPPPPVTQGPKG